MATTKQDVLDMLRELTELSILEEGDPQSFRVRAYEGALQALSSHPGDPTLLTLKELQKIKGVGKSTAEKIRELIDAGSVKRLEALRDKHPRGVVELFRLHGLGPKNVLRLRKELGIQSVDDLRQALKDQKLRTLSGFGAKSEERIAQGLARLDAMGHLGRTPISVALKLARRIVEELQGLEGVSHASYCGSLRRFSETVGDIDVVCVSTRPAAVMDALIAMPFVESVLGRGETKTSIVSRRGTQVDLRVVAAHQLGAAQLYFTGSKQHNIQLRQRALARGWTLNEYALSELDGGKVVASETEEAIYAALGLPWIPPVLREGAGEIEAAEAGRLPSPLGELYGDFHMHTSTSGDAEGSLEDMVAAAKARGYRVLAITDHAEGTRPGVKREALVEQRARVRALQAELGASMRLLHGVELNIGAKGELDYDAEFRASFDWCLASVHDHFELSAEQQTARVVAAMRDPAVRMIGHLTARQIGARPPIELDLDAVLAAAEETETALEINGSLPRLDLSVDNLHRARGRNVRFALTSDAHSVDELRLIEYARLNAERAWLEREQVVNTWEAARLEAWASG